MKFTAIALSILTLSTPALAATEATTVPAAPILTQPAQTKPQPKTQTKSAQMAPKVAEAKAKPQPRTLLRTDFEISGLTSETSDQFYGRLNHNRSFGQKKFFMRLGYAGTETRTYTGKRTNSTNLDTYAVDTQYRTDRRQSYTFVAANALIRLRDPATSSYPAKSGYWMVTAGAGRKVMPGVEGEAGLASITSYDNGDGNHLQPVFTFRLKSPITDTLALDGEALFVEPFRENVLVDSRFNMTYKLTDALGLRLTWVANNLLTPATSRTGWDKSLRLSIVFSSARS